MIIGEKSTGELVLLFQKELASFYPETEIKSILNALFDDIMGWSRATLHLNQATLLSEEVSLRFMEALGRLAGGEPIQYIIGHTEFCGLNLRVQPGVLIPRPETEELAVMVTRDNLLLRDQVISILDIGTGSGCLALAMKRAFPKANVTGIDKSATAIAVAGENARLNHLEADFVEGDILNLPTLSSTASYHIILSNPPYIPEQERPTLSRHVADHEPGEALFVPDNNPLLFYKAIALYAKTHLMPHGQIFVEIHQSRGEDTVDLFSGHGFQSVKLLKDYFGNNRFVKALAPA
ncbi:peptide chain release factor N(5)-glutamine methyltransferase [Bacteroidota bacterium]